MRHEFLNGDVLYHPTAPGPMHPAYLSGPQAWTPAQLRPYFEALAKYEREAAAFAAAVAVDKAEREKLRRAEVRRADSYLAEFVRLRKEADTGQVTSNPYIHAMRHLNKGGDPDLATLNAVLAYNNQSLDSSELSLLLSVEPVELPWPLPGNDPAVFGIIGAVSGRNRVPTVYVFTDKLTGKRYVGSSINPANRIRTYLYPAKADRNRSIIQLMGAVGAEGFTLQVYTLPSHLFPQGTPYDKIGSYAAMLEQYYILATPLALLINDIVVVGSTVKIKDGPLSQVSRQHVSVLTARHVFVYNADGTVLLFKADSKRQLSLLTGIPENSLTYLDTPSLRLGTYLLSSVPLEGAVPALVSAELFGAQYRARSVAYKGEMAMRPPKALFLTDTSVSPSVRLHFSSQSAAFKHASRVGKPLQQLAVKYAPRPCMSGVWLIETPETPESSKSPPPP